MVEYDIIIIGAGAAGLTAGLYAVRAGMKVLLLEKAAAGGQLLLTETIENFPGFPQGIKGMELAQRFKEQAQNYGVKVIQEEAKQIVLVQLSEILHWYAVKTESQEYPTHSVIIASGAAPKRLTVPREEVLTGKGVSYCAICDGPLFRDRKVVVVGAGNAACEETLYLSKFARRISIVHRRDRLRADKIYQDRLKDNPNIDFIWNSQVLEILGEEKVTGIKVRDVNSAKERDIPAEGVFIFVGLQPNTNFVEGFLNIDSQGFIITDRNLKTSSSGIFACGDCCAKTLHQVVTACSEGAMAAEAARSYVEELKGTAYA